MSRRSTWSRALVEGLVIVVSILLAFGLDAWWETRQEEEVELGYVARIAADLRETRASIQENADHYRMLLGHAAAITPILDGVQAVPEDTVGFLASVLQASRITAPIVARSAYDDLVSTGNLRLIRSDTLRRELSRFYGHVEVRLDPVDYSGDQEAFRAVVRGVIPVELQVALRENCFESEPLSCGDRPPAVGVRTTVEDLLAEPGLVRMLTFASQAKAVRIGFLLEGAGFTGGFGVVAESIDELLALLSTEYGQE